MRRRVLRAMPSTLIDTHCHVHFNAFKDDTDAVIKGALAEGVQIITVGTQRDTSRSAVETAQKYAGVWATVGLHPNHLFRTYMDEAESPAAPWPGGPFHSRSEDFDEVYYRELAMRPECVAIGECGIDYFHLPDDVPFEEVRAKQERIFRAHLDLADKIGKPVVVHCRNNVSPLPSVGEGEGEGESAHDTVIRILTAYVNAGRIARRGVIHCYSSDWTHAETYFALGFFVSFTGVITFPPKKSAPQAQEALIEVVRRAPLGQIMVETDAPYLTPIPHRGERNEPRYVRFVAERIAEIRNIGYDAVVHETSKNAQELFGLSGA